MMDPDAVVLALDAADVTPMIAWAADGEHAIGGRREVGYILAATANGERYR